MKHELIIIRYGEIALKGKETRKRFEDILVSNIKKALNQKDILNKISKEWGRIYIYTKNIKNGVLKVESEHYQNQNFMLNF